MNFWDIYLPVLAAFITFEVFNIVVAFVLTRRRMKLIEKMMEEQQAQLAERLGQGGADPFANMGMVFFPGADSSALPFPTHSGSEVSRDKKETNVGQYV